jgi:hypothetical protein
VQKAPSAIVPRVPVHRLQKENHVYGPFTLKNGRLTFRTGDAALTQRLRADRDKGREATVYLLATRPIQDFTGHLESHELIVGVPAQWEVVMRERAATTKLQLVR